MLPTRSARSESKITGVTQDNGTVKFDNLKYGYYFITSTLGTMVTIDTAGKNVEVVDKNESIPEGPEKKITAEDNAINDSLSHQSETGETSNDTSVT